MAYDKNEILDYTAFNSFDPCRQVNEGELVPVGWTGRLAEMIPVAKFSLQDITWGVVNIIKDETTMTTAIANHMYDMIVLEFPNRAVEMQHYRDSPEPEKSLYKMTKAYLDAGGTEEGLKNFLIQTIE